MKSLTTTLLLGALLLIGTSCNSDSDNNNDDGQGTETPLEQSEIRLKIAEYYSAPSTPAQAVEAVRIAFNNEFPGATDMEWKTSNNVYEIEFEIGRIDHEVWYDSNANQLMYKHDIALSELPQNVASVIATDYPGYTLDEAEKVYKGDITGFFIDLKKNKTEIHAFYNQDGTFISKNIWEDDSVKPANDATTETPSISGSLTADQADALIEAYYNGYDTDIAANNVPSAITQNFNTLFPGARDIDWETSADVYKVDFEINNVDYDAWYTQDGTLLAYRFDITRSSIPQAVRTGINERFAGYSIDDAEKIVKPGSTGYQVELESSYMEEDAYYGEDGTYISNLFYKKNNNSGGTPTEPITPEIPVSDNYTDEEIDALLLAYERGRDIDVRPSDLPTVLSTTFANQFSGAYDVEWERVDNIYKVEFEIGNTEYEAWYVENGVILMFIQEVRFNTVPTAVQNSVSSQYNGYMVDGCDYFQKGTVKGYIVDLENNRTDAELTVLFGEDGSVIYQMRD